LGYFKVVFVAFFWVIKKKILWCCWLF